MLEYVYFLFNKQHFYRNKNSTLKDFPGIFQEIRTKIHYIKL